MAMQLDATEEFADRVAQTLFTELRLDLFSLLVFLTVSLVVAWRAYKLGRDLSWIDGCYDALWVVMSDPVGRSADDPSFETYGRAKARKVRDKLSNSCKMSGDWGGVEDAIRAQKRGDNLA